MALTVALIGLAGVVLGGLIAAFLEKAEDTRRGQRTEHVRLAEKEHEEELEELRRLHRQRLHLMPERLEAYAAVLADADEADRVPGSDRQRDAGVGEGESVPSLDPLEIETSLRAAVQIALFLAATSEVRLALVAVEKAAIANLVQAVHPKPDKSTQLRCADQLRRATSDLRDSVRAEIGLRALRSVATEGR